MTAHQETIRLRTGEQLILRPICAEDEALMIAFHQRLSDRSVYFRYFQLIPLDRRIAHQRLMRVCYLDPDMEMALVAERNAAERNVAGPREILAVGRLIRLPDKNEAEFAILVRDDLQGQGIGTELLRHLIAVARENRLDAIFGAILPENRAMAHVCKQLGFDLHTLWEQGEIEARLALH